MKFLKGLATFIIGLSIFVLTLSLTFTYIFKNIIQKQVIGDAVRDIVISEYIKDKDVENKEKIEELLEDKDATKLVNVVIDEYLDSLRNNDYQVSEDSLDTIIELCLEHRSQLSEISQEEIKEEDIKSPETRENLRKAFNEGFSKANTDIGETGKTVINYYSNYTSTAFKVVLVSSIIIGLILIGLINWSYFRPMRTMGNCLLLTGILISLIYFLLTVLVNELIKNVDEISISINTKPILVLGIVEIVLGILLIIAPRIIKKILAKKKENNEIEQPQDIIKKRNAIIASISAVVILILLIILFINIKQVDFTPRSSITSNNNNGGNTIMIRELND